MNHACFYYRKYYLMKFKKTQKKKCSVSRSRGSIYHEYIFRKKNIYSIVVSCKGSKTKPTNNKVLSSNQKRKLYSKLNGYGKT